MRYLFTTALAVACCTASGAVPAPGLTASQSPTRDPAARAAALLARAQQAMGNAERLRALGGLTIEAVGTLDKAAEHQGRRPDSLDPGPFRERLTASPSGRLAYEYREDRFDGTFESLRQVYTEDDERLIVLSANRQVIRLRSPEHPEARRRLARRMPVLLLAELIGRAEDLHWIGRVSEERIELPFPSGRTMTLGFDPERAVLTRAEYRMDMPSFGDATITWRFLDYAPVEELGLFPRRYTCTIQGGPTWTCTSWMCRQERSPISCRRRPITR